MATVTKPIALDESLNTTELSSRNVADVLAQELSAVATAIGGIAVPSADHVSYDNSVSGLSATDVQNAIDEIVSDIPTVNNGTLTIQQNGTSKGTFTANSASNVNVNIETPTSDKKTATDKFTTADGGLLSKCQINFVPVQSGSGDPSPDNVRPISGHTEVDLDVKDGDNVTQHTYQVQIGSTVYGGTVDLVSGVMNVTHGYVDLGSLTWTYTPDATRAFRSSSRLNNALLPVTSNDKPSAICSALSVVNYMSMTTAVADLTIIWSDSSYYGQVWCDYPNITSVNDFKTAVTGVMLVYELATPTTIQLTPQQIEALVGQNNLSTPLDGQSIDSVKYREVFAFDDVEKVVSLRVPISMLGTDESGNTTASRAYTTGEFFYKDGKMYKVLTNIASGATFTVGTNISETTLFAELTALA